MTSLPLTADHRRFGARALVPCALLGSLLLLAGCGADVAATSATVAHTEAQAAKAALAQQDRMMKALDQANHQAEQRLKQADQ